MASFIPPPSPCPYLPDRTSQLHYELIPRMDPGDYMKALRDGWRRFGSVIFRPECPSCQMCQSLRVLVSSFQPSESQRRAWKKNAGDVTIRISSPASSPEKLDLFERFHQHGHETKGWPTHGQPNLDVFLHNPFATEEWDYYVGDRLIGVGYVDALPEGLSAIYFFYDPGEGHRSLGTFNILALIAAARERDVPHVYLGYFVAGYRSLEYKGSFKPNEVIGVDGRWDSAAQQGGSRR